MTAAKHRLGVLSLPKALAGQIARAARGTYMAARSAPGRVWTAVTTHPRRTLGILGVSIVVFGVMTTTFVLLTHRHAAVEAARSAATEAAEKSVGVLLSYDHRSLVDDLPGREALLTGPFKDEYASLVRDVVTPAATRDQLLTRANVSSIGVIDDDGTEKVRVLMFVNQTSTSNASPDPFLGGSRVQVTMQNENGAWLVSELTPV